MTPDKPTTRRYPPELKERAVKMGPGAPRVPRAWTNGRGKKFVTQEVMISERPADV